MHFTGEWLQSLLENLKANAASPGNNNRRVDGEQRQHARVGLRFCAKMLVMEQGHVVRSLQVHVRDISPQGMCIIYSQKLRAKDQFMIELPMEEGGFFRVLCEVRNCRKLDNKLFGIGSQILSTSIEAPAPEAPQKTNRQPAPRRPVATSPVATVDDVVAATANESLDVKAAELRRKMFEGV